MSTTIIPYIVCTVNVRLYVVVQKVRGCPPVVRIETIELTLAVC